MKLNDNERYEVRAEAFRIMTGHMAPGKDVSPLSYGASYEDGLEAYRDWLAKYGDVTSAMLQAFDSALRET